METNKAVDRENLIGVRELHEKLSGEDLPPIVIDVRSHADYEAGHIPDALNYPTEQILDWLTRLPNGRPVVTYCDMQHPGSSRSERAAQQLREVGFQARALRGGFPAWKDAEYDVDQGPRSAGEKP